MTTETSASREAGGTRLRMLDVAETHFARKGYEGAHLESIATEVGVRKTALYYYFDSKAALYTAVLDRISVEVDRVIGDALRRTDLDYVPRFELILDAFNGLLASNLNYAQILQRIFVDRIPISDASVITPALESALGSLMELYQQGKEAGVFRKLSARQVVIHIVGMSTFFYAGRESSAQVLGVEDVAAPGVVKWQAQSMRDLVMRGVIER